MSITRTRIVVQVMIFTWRLNIIIWLALSGTFTNQIQTAFREPRLLIVADTRADHQPITESSYANIPVVAFCNIDSPTRYCLTMSE